MCRSTPTATQARAPTGAGAGPVTRDAHPRPPRVACICVRCVVCGYGHSIAGFGSPQVPAQCVVGRRPQQRCAPSAHLARTRGQQCRRTLQWHWAQHPAPRRRWRRGKGIRPRTEQLCIERRPYCKMGLGWGAASATGADAACLPAPTWGSWAAFARPLLPQPISCPPPRVPFISIHHLSWV